MNIYQARKAAHMCVRCGRITERTLTGKCRCQECEDKTVASKRYHNQLMRRKHLCIWCGKPSEERLCPSCREIERRRAREWKEKKRATVS